MVQSPSWEANWFAASQEIPRISRNPKVHYRTHKRPPPVGLFRLQSKHPACECFITKFLQGGVVSTSPNPQAIGSLLVGCPRLLIQYIRSYPTYRRPFLYPQLEKAPCRGVRDPLHGTAPRIQNLLRNSPSLEFDIKVCITESHKRVTIKTIPQG